MRASPLQRGIPAVVMRGGTSKGLYFKAEDLPAEAEQRDRLLLAVMGSPDARQIDGMGGAHPLTSKVAVVSRCAQADADVDYLFLQVLVDRAQVSDGQNCGNILAGVGPFAIENGMAGVSGQETEVRIRMVNSGGIAVATVQTPEGTVSYAGRAAIDGVPGTAAPVMLDFADVAGGRLRRPAAYRKSPGYHQRHCRHLHRQRDAGGRAARRRRGPHRLRERGRTGK